MKVLTQPFPMELSSRPVPLAGRLVPGSRGGQETESHSPLRLPRDTGTVHPRGAGSGMTALSLGASNFILEQSELKQTPNPASQKERIISYYEKAGRDYGTWSKKYNMHFGYYEKGMNPLDREAMLEKLNAQVFKRLQMNEDVANTIADFGCGLGATLRHGARSFPASAFKGVTLVPWQVEQARSLNAQDQNSAAKSIEIIETDYTRTPFATGSLDGVIAIESSCYATGSNKSDLLNEIFRVLKPGGRFVISDGFLKKPVEKASFLGRAYDQLCTSWALNELGNIHHVQQHLEKLSIRDLRIEEISLRVAPSVAHVPFTVISFLLKELLFGEEPMNQERWNNLKSPLLTMILGSARSHFGYFLVSGKKDI